jgi:hypothetical protein
MKLSQETQAILKNFASIKPGIIITPGNKLWSRTSYIFAEATVKETFPTDILIYDIGNFLSVLNLFDDPNIDFGEEYMSIYDTNGTTETRYLYAAPGSVTQTYPKKLQDVPKEGINFTMTEEQWAKMQKAVGVFKKKEIKIQSNGKVIRICTADHKNEHGNTFSMVLAGDPQGQKCDMYFQTEYMDLIKGSYSGVITPTFTIYTHTSGLDLYYYIGSDPTSVYGDGE